MQSIITDTQALINLSKNEDGMAYLYLEDINKFVKIASDQIINKTNFTVTANK